jgi:hypothetical protein
MDPRSFAPRLHHHVPQELPLKSSLTQQKAPSLKLAQTPGETMNEEQVRKLIGMIKALDSKIETLKNEVGGRFNEMERRIANIEGALPGLVGPGQSHTPSRGPTSAATNAGHGSNPLPRRGAYSPKQPPRGPSDQRADPPSRAVGYSDNVTFLPFVIERIAWRHQQKAPNDSHIWSVPIAHPLDFD